MVVVVGLLVSDPEGEHAESRGALFVRVAQGLRAAGAIVVNLRREATEDSAPTRIYKDLRLKVRRRSMMKVDVVVRLAFMTDNITKPVRRETWLEWFNRLSPTHEPTGESHGENSLPIGFHLTKVDFTVTGQGRNGRTFFESDVTTGGKPYELDDDPDPITEATAVVRRVVGILQEKELLPPRQQAVTTAA